MASGPSTSPSGMPGYGGQNSTTCPDGNQPSPCPPVWLSRVTEICSRGPGTSPSATAFFTPASAPAASRTMVIPAARVAARFLTVSKNR